MSSERAPKSLDDLLAYVVANVPNCPLVLVRQAVVETARDLCTFSRCWRHELDPISIRADRTDYDLDGWPRQSDVAGVFLVELRDYTQDDALLGTLLPGEQYTLVNRNVLRLLSKPEADQVKALRVTVWLQPTPDATTIDERVYLDHYHRLTKGALARLHLMPAKTWSNPQLGLMERVEYEQERGFARIESDRGSGMMTQERMMPRDSFL